MQDALTQARKPSRRVFLSTQENGDFDAIYVTEQSPGVDKLHFFYREPTRYVPFCLFRNGYVKSTLTQVSVLWLLSSS